MQFIDHHIAKVGHKAGYRRTAHHKQGFKRLRSNQKDAVGVFEKPLFSVGGDIAMLIVKVDSSIAERVLRERWVEQARELYAKKYGKAAA